MIFSKLPLSPNQWTIISLIPAIITFYFLFRGELLLAAGAFFISAFIDVIDGAVARVQGRVTALGAYLDTIVDRVVEFLFIAGLLFVSFPALYVPSYFWIVLLMFGSFMTTYTKAAASEKKIVQEELKGGILERGERLILFVVILAVSSYDLTYGMYLIAITAGLTLITALQRFVIGIKSSKIQSNQVF